MARLNRHPQSNIAYAVRSLRSKGQLITNSAPTQNASTDALAVNIDHRAILTVPSYRSSVRVFQRSPCLHRAEGLLSPYCNRGSERTNQGNRGSAPSKILLPRTIADPFRGGPE
ncbi:hypothetical protein PhiH1_275 [Halobacterium phage phiH]|uniref:Uncharacterized 12.3 kDa protein in repressor 5'region n=2 Tax=Halobacterium phage phiH TaxID=169684 RepID=Y12K_BPPHH|nr:hypothetical protein JR051_gp56 [Halobacterium phage phiH]P23788.1 RecName: Full=Uncharacterized 12.3 kDa protein in repressor 5'region [Halobacterium phage phiH]AYM00301.1 hypothetical protein PhiH1_275 [Halobacterium phage phiH]CAA36745.1 unnamed protein product [Halobacterium phage phiH]